MKFIGITGGVGAGKTAILSYLGQKENVRVMLADEIAHDLMEPHTACYKEICSHFPEADIYTEDGHFDRNKLAAVIFSDEENRRIMNGIVHPAVKQYVVEQQRFEREKGQLSFLILEAALLIEEHYDEICDELWYIYTSEENRRERLKSSRGYSDQKIDEIFASQLKEADYRKVCKQVIDNNGDLQKAYLQIDHALRR